MILQALHDYYERRCADADPARRLPVFGLENREVGFILELGADGVLTSVVDVRRQVGSKKLGTAQLLPAGVKKTSGVSANLLWDNAEYVLALPDPKKFEAARNKGKSREYLVRLTEMQAAFRRRIEALPLPARDDAGIKAVVAFLNADPAKQVERLRITGEVASSNLPLTFRMVDDVDMLVSQRPAVAPYVVGEGECEDDEASDTSQGVPPASAMCLVTGITAPAARLHSAIKGVWGAQTSGANIVSFNLDAFNSYGKTQGQNAPVSRAAAFAYTTALNTLLARDSTQRMQVADASTVYWAQRPDPLEEDLAALLGSGVDDPDAHTERVRALYEAIRTGAFETPRGDNRFYVLGLAPNAARIAVCFWHDGTLRELAAHLELWFDDLAITRGPHDPEHPALFMLLAATAVQGKSDNVLPHLASDLTRSVLEGTALPKTILQATLQRCRAEQAKKSDAGKPVPHVSYSRAALLKACINRLVRAGHLEGELVTVNLDVDTTDAAYLLGRLFATYERIQSDAAGRDLNRSIRDAYFGSAMSNPASVFPRLIQLNQHHMRDLRRSVPGLHVNRDRLLGELWGGLSKDFRFPSSQSLTARARFALGYYHQRQAFFNKPEASAAATFQGSH